MSDTTDFIDKFQDDVRRQILRFRQEKGLTQEELASKLAVDADTVRRWEEGVAFPSTVKIIRELEEMGLRF